MRDHGLQKKMKWQTHERMKRRRPKIKWAMSSLRENYVQMMIIPDDNGNWKVQDYNILF